MSNPLFERITMKSSLVPHFQWRKAVIAAAAIASLLTPSIASAQTSTKLLLDWAYESSHAVFTPGLREGLFKKEGLDVTIDRGHGSGDTVAKVAAGTYDFGSASINAVIPFNAKNPNNRVVVVFVVYDGVLNSLIGLKSRGIKTLKDIEGKKIVTAANHDGYLFFNSFAQKAGIDASKIEWVIASSNVRDALVAQRRGDGMLGISTARLALEEIGTPSDDISVFLFSDHLPDLISRGIIVSEKTIRERPELVRSFVRAVVKSVQSTIRDPAAAVEGLKTFDPLINVTLEKRRFEENLKFQLLTPNVQANGLSFITPERLSNNLKSIAPALSIPADTDPLTLYTDKFLPPRSELSVSAAAK